MNAPFIVDSAQRARARKPTEFGMNPFVAEVYQGRGLDPRDHAERLRGIHQSARLARRETPGEIETRVRGMFAGQTRSARFQELALTPGEVVVRQLVQQAALEAYDNESIADEYCPVQFVNERKGTYYVRDRATELQEFDTRVGSSSDSVELPQEIAAGTYDVEDHSASDSVNRATAAAAPSIENRMIAAMRARVMLLRQHEIKAAATLMASGSYNASNTKTIASGAQWNGGASSDPIDDCQDAIAGCTAPPTHAIFGLETWQAAQANDTLMSIVGTRPDNRGLLAADSFAMYWGLESVLISRRQYIPSGTSTLTRMYGTASVAFVHVSRDENARTFLRTFMLRQGAHGLVALPYFDPKKGIQGTDIEKVSFSKVIKVIDDTYGYLLINARQ